MLVAIAVFAGACAGSGDRNAVAERWAVDDVRASASWLTAIGPASVEAQGRASASWCGAPTQTDLTPNGIAGFPVHWIYAIPSDGQDRFSTVSSDMQADADTMTNWWRGQDPTRVPRNDVAPFSCGTQLDISSARLPQSSSELSSNDTKFETIANSLIAAGFGSRFTKYVVYYDGPADPGLCGEGGSDPTGLGYAVVFLQGCPSVPASVIATHELTHTLGAVPTDAPHMCPPPHEGHVCDDPHDLMYPFADGTPLSGLVLDTGRDDYYGHSDPWPDVQDSAWLVQLDRQAPFTLTVTGPGSATADVPGLLCAQTCTTTWNANTSLILSATPSKGAKLVHWSGGCAGVGTCSVTASQTAAVSALFAPLTYRLTVGVTGKGVVSSSRAGIACPGRCASSFPSYQALRLTARPAKGWRLASWRGACRGTRLSCAIPMTIDTSARAVFARR